MSRDERSDDRDVDDDLFKPGRPEQPSATPGERSPGGSFRDLDRTDHRSSGRGESIRWHHRTIQIRDAESRLLRTVGTFRVVATADLEKLAYDGHGRQLQRAVQSLERQGFIRRFVYADRDGHGSHKVVTLTRDGYELARHEARGSEQTLHWGSVQLKQIAHDTALYRLYHEEASRIEHEGGVVRRVMLDPELKGLVASALRRSTPAPDATGEAAARAHHAAVAESVHLRVVDGTIQIPDLRVEYDSATGDRTRVDLELATEDYNVELVASKARAGFTIYAPPNRTERLTAALEERGIVADIFSL
jgi:hypothetical protein